MTVAEGLSSLGVGNRLALELPDIRDAKRPALFFCNAYGDHLLVRPTVLALQAYFRGKLGYIGLVHQADVFFPDADFRFVHEIPFLDGPHNTHRFEWDDLTRVMDQFDAIISLNAWDSEQMRDLAEAILPKPFIGLAPFYGKIAPIDARTHMVDHNFKLAKWFDPSAAVENFSALQPIPAINQQRAAQIRSLLPPSCKLLTVHTWTRNDKEWPRERFKAVIEMFLASHPDYVAVIVDPLDTGLDSGAYEARIFSLDGVDLQTATTLVASSDLFLGIDSYFLHAADFARVPSVGIFGPTSPTTWGVRFSKHEHVAAPSTAQIDITSVYDALKKLASSIDVIST